MFLIQLRQIWFLHRQKSQSVPLVQNVRFSPIRAYRFRISSQHTLTYFMFSLRSQCSFYQRVEVLAEHLHQISPLLFPFQATSVEFLFYAGRKVIVHNFRKYCIRKSLTTQPTSVGISLDFSLPSFPSVQFLYIFSRQFQIMNTHVSLLPCYLFYISSLLNSGNRRAYVDGRPIPSSSSLRTRLASV